MPQYHEFEVSLIGVKPRIWRSFLLREKATFLDLHEAIQDACGWWNYHLFIFRDAGRRSSRGRIAQGPPIAGIPSDEDRDLFGRRLPHAGRTKLAAYFGENLSSACHYEYDFGDGWLHEVKWGGTKEEKDTFKRRLLGGERAFPREDCGGLGGYERCVEFCQTGKDTMEDDPKGLREWLGDWEPDKFDFELTKKYFDANWHVPCEGEDWKPSEKDLEVLAKGGRPKGMPRYEDGIAF